MSEGMLKKIWHVARFRMNALVHAESKLREGQNMEEFIIRAGVHDRFWTACRGSDNKKFSMRREQK